MSHLWVQQDSAWNIFPLDSRPILLSGDRNDSVRCADWFGPACASLGPIDSDWVLLCQSESVRVNGDAVPLGIRVLSDKDEIAIKGGARLFFSAETLARVAPFPGAQPIRCPRCTRPIAPGAPSVRCKCGVTYHQNDDVAIERCWTYDCKCGSCGETTDLDAGFRWSPEGL